MVSEQLIDKMRSNVDELVEAGLRGMMPESQAATRKLLAEGKAAVSLTVVTGARMRIAGFLTFADGRADCVQLFVIEPLLQTSDRVH